MGGLPPFLTGAQVRAQKERIMWDMLEFIGAIGEVFTSWRFFVCLLFTSAMVGLIYLVIPDQTVCLWVSIPVALVGVCIGIGWEWRNR